MNDRLHELCYFYTTYVTMKYRGKKGEDVTVPSLYTFLHMELVDDFMMEDDYRREVDVLRWCQFEYMAKTLILKYREELIDRHSDVLIEWMPYNNPEAVNPDPLFCDQLFLASSFFYDRDYDGPYYIPQKQLMVFGVRKAPVWFTKLDLENQNDYSEWRTEGNVSFTNIKVHALAVEVANALLRDLGLPLTTSMSDVMRQTGDRIMCERCHENTKAVTTWPLMVNRSN